MKSETGKRIINEIVEETGLSRNVVYKIIMSQYGCLRDTMRAANPEQPETFQSVRYPHLGIFKPRMKFFHNMKANQERIQRYNEIKKRLREQRYGTSDKK